jgi:hypothetical protein
MDFMTQRQWWRVIPGRNKLLWEIAERRPTTSQEIMVEFKCVKNVAQNALFVLQHHRYITRERGMTRAPEDIDRYKQKKYSYPGGQKAPKFRKKRPSFYKYYPTPRSMEIFLERFPDRVKNRKEGVQTWWKAVRIRKDRTPGKPLPTSLPKIHPRSILGQNLKQTNNRVGITGKPHTKRNSR